MASVIKAGNATDGVQVTSDNTGILELKTGTGSGTTAMTVGTGQNVTFAQAANLPNTFGFKNRIINGGMVIDQRNAGASVTPGAGTYALDRWKFWRNGGSGSANYTVQQSSIAPSGFTNSMLITQTASFSPTGTQYNNFAQYIEGFNTADLAWGTASASTVTLSFWVRSSLTGTFGGAVSNNAQDRSYPFTYTISAANTFEYKTITIPGDTTGTWLTNNSAGVLIFWQLGVGSSYLGTAGAWAGAAYLGATGATNITATNGATFYITGVQLEKGSTATSFDYRPYTTELQLCQRYFETSFNAGTAPANNIDDGFQTIASGTSNATAHISFAVAKRASPTMTFYSSNVMTSPTPTNGQWQFNNGTSWGNGSSTQANRARMYGFSVYSVMGLAGGYAAPVAGNWVASSEL